jgi:hypothetical protein
LIIKWHVENPQLSLELQSVHAARAAEALLLRSLESVSVILATTRPRFMVTARSADKLRLMLLFPSK